MTYADAGPMPVHRSVGWGGSQLVQCPRRAHRFNSVGAWQYFENTLGSTCNSSEGDRCLNRQR